MLLIFGDDDHKMFDELSRLFSIHYYDLFILDTHCFGIHDTKYFSINQTRTKIY